jgi:hypothetical protein
VETTPFEDPVAFHKPWVHNATSPENFGILYMNCPVIAESRSWSSDGAGNHRLVKSCLNQ